MPATSRFAAPGRLILAFALALLVVLTAASSARAAGTIELVKNQSGGSNPGTVDFMFRTANFGTSSEQTGFPWAEEDGAKSWSVPANNASATVYQLEELTPPADWALTGIVCTNPGGGADADTTVVGTFANIKVSDGQTVTCTFTNAPPQCNPDAGPFAPLTFSKFQGIDGDQCDQNGLTGSLNQWFDWQKITRDGGFKAPNGDGSTSIDADAVPMGVFKGGSKEEEPEGWVLQSGSPNGKTNILAQWGFPETTTTDPLKDHLFLYLAFARQQENGSTNFAFELNQNPPSETFLVPTTGGGQPAIKRRDGDVLIAYNWTGGAVAEISLCEWTGTDPAQPWLKGTWSGPLAVNNDPCPVISDNVGATTAQGRSNDWTISNYLPGVPSILPPGNTMPATTFGEASIDLTEALQLGAPGGDPCASFGSFWMRSRTSPSITATPMDLIPPQAVHVANCGTVKIKKVTSPNPDPTTTSFDFTGSGFDTAVADGQQANSPAAFSLANGQTEEIIKVEPNDQAGDPAYSITEQAETGWNLTGLSCTEDKTANSTTSTATGVVGLKVEPGETIECTYTNSVKPASLTVVKDAAPDHAQDFGFAQTGLTGQSATFDLDDDADGTLSNTKTYANRTDFGKKLITETPGVSGWTLSGIACTGNAAVRYGQLSNGAFVEGANGPQFGAGDTTAEVDLQADKTATCTFTNSATAASLSVVKDASPNHEQDFGFTQSGLTGAAGTFQLDDDPSDTTLLTTQAYPNRTDFGTKLVTETPVSGWTLSNISCTGTAAVRYGQLDGNGAFTGGPGGDAFASGDTTVEVDLQPGRTANCTFVNTAAAASLSIVKNASPDHPQDFGFQQSGLTGEPATFDLDDDNDNTLSNTKPYANRLDFGKKVVSEVGVAAWTATGISCTGTAAWRAGSIDQNGTFTVGAGTNAFEQGDHAVEVDLQPGKTATCTFTNAAAPASLSIVKNAAPDHPQDFGFAQDGLVTENATFDLDDDANNTLDDTKTYGNRSDFGTKVVREAGVASWSLTLIACTGTATVRIGKADANGQSFTLDNGTGGFEQGDNAVEVDLQPGKTATCTFTNTAAAASLEIVKDAAPDHAQDFGFAQAGVTGQAATFDLDDDANNTLANTKTYGNRTDFGTKVVREVGVANWSLSGIACTGTATVRIGKSDANGQNFTLDNGTGGFEQGDNAVEVDLQPGRTAQCTFTNTAAPANVTIVKDAAPDHEENFGFDQVGFTGANATFALDDDADATLDNTKSYTGRTDFGTKLVTEAPSGAWSLSNIACTGTATVRIGKIDGNSSAFVLDGKTAGFEAGDTTVEIDLQPGRTASCTFTNTAHPASLTIVKDAAPDHAQDFGFTQDGLTNEDATFALDDDADNTLSDTKTYSGRTDFGWKLVTEAPAADWTLTGIACTGNAPLQIGTLGAGGAFTLGNGGTGFDAGDTTVKVLLNPGLTASCTFTNTAAPASLTVVKDAAPDHAQDFGFDQAGLTNEDATFDLDDDANNTLENTKSFGGRTDFGTKLISEDATANWTLSAIACTGNAAVRYGQLSGGAFVVGANGAQFGAGDTTVEVDLQPGKSASCTFTNTAAPAVAVVVKDADPDHSQNFAFEQDGFTGEDATFQLDDDADNALPNTKTYDDRTDFGTKLVTETPSANWTLTNIVCTGTAAVRIGTIGQNGFTIDGKTDGFEAGDTTVEIDVQPGKTATCTFTNTATPGSVTIVKDAAPDHEQDFGFTQTGLTNENGGFTLDDDADSARSNTKTYADRTDFGKKVVSEDGGVANWSLTGISCTGDAAVRIGKRDVNGAFTLDSGTDAYEAGDTAVEIDVQPGKSASCTFVNTAAPALAVVVKDADPDHGQNFTFAQDGLTNESGTFTLDDDGDNALSNTKTYADRTDFGKKLITETPSANWTLTNIVCTGDAAVRIGRLDSGDAFTLDGKGDGFDAGDTTIEVDLQPGKAANCTFTNTAAPGSITVIKDAAPDHGQDFGFAQTGLVNETAAFDLDDDADNTLSNTKTYANRKDFGTKVISEDADVDHWTLTDIACTGDATVRIGLLDQNGVFTLNGESADFEDGDNAVEIDLQPGKSASCTFTNTADPASLSIVKDADPNHAQDFAFDQAGLTSEAATFDLDDDASNTLSDTKTYADRKDFGTKVISEDAGPKGWTLTKIECTGSAGVRIGKLGANGFTLGSGSTGFEAGDDAVEVDLQPGKTASCTFTNTGRGTLVVEKQTAPDETNGATFGFATAAPGGAASFSLADDGTDSRTLPPGAYTVTEDAKVGYRLTDVDCDDTDSTQTGDTQAVQDRRAAYSIEVGETVKCTFTNLKIDASTVVVKSGNEFAYHGDDVTFSFEVTNPGNSPLHDVVVTDDRCANVTGPVKQVNAGDPNELDPGDKWGYGCTMPVPAHAEGEQNPFRNVVTVNAKDEQDRPVSSSDDHLTRILHPAIAVEKTGPANGTAGLPVVYRIAVSNPGDIGFASDRVTVQDELCEAPPILVTDGKRRGDGADPTPATLDPGDTWLYSCTVQTAIGQERVDNVVNVGGTDPNGRTVDASATAGTLLRQPVQQVEPQRAQPGSARLQGPASCVTKPFKVVVRGREIDAVTLFVRGKAVRTLRARQAVVLSATSKRVLVDGKVQTVRSAQSQQVFTFRVDPRQLRAGAVHRVSARVTFTTSSGTKSRQLKFAFQRCQAARKPRFTG